LPDHETRVLDSGGEGVPMLLVHALYMERHDVPLRKRHDGWHKTGLERARNMSLPRYRTT
jgi:hypothetical protein